MLFRYSALTFNGHRIHYDRPYATLEEDYPGLVVHGPLIATLLIDLLVSSCPEMRIKTAKIRAVSPSFDGERLFLNGRRAAASRTIELWACDSADRVAMRVSVEEDNTACATPGKGAP
jgi:3-methylfumaryl-CoA hydratase